MKKLLFALFAATTIFSSCSSDNDPISQDTNPDPVKYTVNLNVKSAGFEVDKAPLKSTQANPNQASFMQVIVYNESGSVYSDTIVDQSTLTTENNTSSMTLELPKGNYYLSIFNRIYDSYHSKLEDVIVIPNNYQTDYYDRGVTDVSNTKSNVNMYYYTETLNITEDNNTVKNIILYPLWSNIKSIDTKLSDTFVYPAGISGEIKQISKRYYGFGIKSTLAKTLYPYLYEEFSWLSIPFSTDDTPIAISKAEDPNLYLDLCYVKASSDGHSGGRVMKVQKIKLPIEIENGMNYTISGTIPSIDSIDSNLINIKLEPFKNLNISFQ